MRPVPSSEDGRRMARRRPYPHPPHLPSATAPPLTSCDGAYCDPSARLMRFRLSSDPDHGRRRLPQLISSPLAVPPLLRPRPCGAAYSDSSTHPVAALFAPAFPRSLLSKMASRAFPWWCVQDES